MDIELLVDTSSPDLLSDTLDNVLLHLLYTTQNEPKTIPRQLIFVKV